MQGFFELFCFIQIVNFVKYIQQNKKTRELKGIAKGNYKDKSLTPDIFIFKRLCS